MEPLIQTLALATILLIIGLIFTILGVVGLVWKTRHDQRQREKTENTATAGENADRLRQQPRSSKKRSLTI